jgi:hypothetical protein
MPTYSKYSPVGGGGGTGGITSINGDTTAAQLIVGGTGISVATALGTTTITNTSPAPATGNLTETISSILTITGGTGAVVGSGTTIQVLQAGAAQDGFLSSADWNTFNNKQPAGTYVTSVTGSAPIASSGGTTPAISITQSGVATDGYLSSTDWNTFNNKATYPAFSDDQVLYSTTTGAEWRTVGTGSTTAAYPTDTVIVGRTKPAGLTGVGNFIIGDGALNSLTTQTNNIAIGKNAASLVANTVLPGNIIVIGFEALKNATASYQDGSALSFGSICIGYQAGSNITSSFGNLYIGYQAGRGGGRHDNNVAIGHLAGNAGAENTCVGTSAGSSSGNFSMTAIGSRALRVANANYNSAVGSQAGREITTGYSNTLLGANASYYTLAGGVNLTTGNSNTLLGTESATLANNSVGAISLGIRAAAASKEFAVGSAAYDIETVLLGRGGASQTVANAVKIQTMRASGTDTSMTVGTLTLAGAQGTGAGAGGDVIIATAPAGASGSSLNSHVDRLKVTASGETQLLGSTSGYVGLSSPAAPTSYSLVLPSAQGAASSVLTNDGSGNLSWTVPVAVETYFGDGSDGSLTVTTSSTTSGPLVSGALTRDAYFDDLTISGSGQIFTNGWRLYVRGTLTLSAAGANAINYNGNNGNNATGSTGGTAPTAQGNSGFVGGNTQGRAGVNGGTGVGTAGVAGTGPIAGNSGGAGLGGAGGGGGAGAGGAVGIAPPSPVRAIIRKQTDLLLGVTTFGAITLSGGAVGGSGGSGAGNGGGNTGGGSGSSGNSGGVVYVAAKIISRGGGTAAGAISAKAGTAGDGGDASAGNSGGGGGAGGSGGGYVYLYFYRLTGTTATNAIDVSGSGGGDAGDGNGSGTGGVGGAGGGGGCILLLDLSTGLTLSAAGASTGSLGTGPTGTTGGTGGAGITTQANL